MTRRVLSLAVTALLLTAVTQLVHGGYLYAKAVVAQVLLERSWERSLAGAEAARPWPWADTWPVARVSFPGHDRASVVLEGASGRNLAFAPGHLHGSVPPGGDGVCVLAGHRDTHFAVLADLVPGDEVVVEDRQGTGWSYRVSEARVVHERDHQAIASQGGAELVLVTCWPFDAIAPGGEERYVVRCRLRERVS